jgi:OHCU decarboxylase
VLLRACASSAWADAVEVGSPYRDVDDLLHRAERSWWEAGEPAWREAFAAHPRIGDRPPAGSTESQEQGALAVADPAVLEAIAEANRVYEARFGMVYLVRARGRTADDLLALLQERLGNDADDELQIAAGQQWEITALRLRDALADEGGARP